jgi:HK97 family phage major capsid protein
MEKMLNSKMAEDKINEALEKRNAIVDEVEAKKEEFENADTDKRDELLEEVEALTEEANKIEEDVKELEEQKDKLAEQEERMSLTSNLSKAKIEERKSDMENVNVLATKEYNQMYADFIRGKVDKKEMRSYLESRALATTTENVPIPEVMQGFVETAWYEYGKFSRLVSETFEPAILKIPVEVEADGANWHDELGEEPQEENITLGQIILQPKMIKKWISLTDELMAMAADDFLRYIADELVYRVVLALDEAIINRTDAQGLGVIGIVDNPNTEVVSAELNFNAINVALANLVTFEDLVIAMNPATFFNNFMGMVDEVGRPIFNVVQDNNSRPQYYLSGHRVEFTQALKSEADASEGDPLFIIGNFRRGYRLNYPQGRNVITLVDPYTLATQDLVRMIGRLYVAGNVVKPKHFAQVNKAGA